MRPCFFPSTSPSSCLSRQFFEVFDTFHRAHGIRMIVQGKQPATRRCCCFRTQPQGQQVRNPLENGKWKIMSGALKRLWG